MTHPTYERPMNCVGRSYFSRRLDAEIEIGVGRLVVFALSTVASRVGRERFDADEHRYVSF